MIDANELPAILKALVRQAYDTLAMEYPLMEYLRDRTSFNRGGIQIPVGLSDGRVAHIGWTGKRFGSIPITAEDLLPRARQKLQAMARHLHSYCLDEIRVLGRKYGGVDLGDLAPTTMPATFVPTVPCFLLCSPEWESNAPAAGPHVTRILDKDMPPDQAVYFRPRTFHLQVMSGLVFFFDIDSKPGLVEFDLYCALVCHHPEDVVYVKAAT